MRDSTLDSIQDSRLHSILGGLILGFDAASNAGLNPRCSKEFNAGFEIGLDSFKVGF